MVRLTLFCRMGPCIAGMLDDFDMKNIKAKIQIWNLTPNNLYLLYSPLDKSATIFKVGTQLKGRDGRIYSSKKILPQQYILVQYFFTCRYRVSRRCIRTTIRCTPRSSGVLQAFHGGLRGCHGHHGGLVHLGIGSDQDSHFDTRVLVSTEDSIRSGAVYVVSIAADKPRLISIPGFHGVLVRKSGNGDNACRCTCIVNFRKIKNSNLAIVIFSNNT